MMAFYAIPFEAGDRILTVEAEYASNYLAYLQLARQKGVIVDTIPSTADGEADVDALRGMIDERVRLISVTHVPTNGGLVNPIEEIGAIAREHDILYLVDACQSAGQMPLNVERIGCDLLSATGRKFLRGPRGSGFLYVSERILDQLHPPMIDLHSAEWIEIDRYRLRADARRFENWESNYAARLGLGRAIDYALEIGLDNIAAEVVRLAELCAHRVLVALLVRHRDLCGERRDRRRGRVAAQGQTYPCQRHHAFRYADRCHSPAAARHGARLGALFQRGCGNRALCEAGRRDRRELRFTRGDLRRIRFLR